MRVELQLFGAFRQYQTQPMVALELPEGACIADLRDAVDAYGKTHWQAFQPALLARSAFASDTRVLRDGEVLPADGKMAVLPPVSGG